MPEDKKELALKVCGMRDSLNIKELLAISPDFMGFIFYEKSPRNAESIVDQQLLLSFPEHTKKVGVFVNATHQFIMDQCLKYKLDHIQLHGDENPVYCMQLNLLGISIIKAFSIDENFDFTVLKDYENHCDYYLFDTKGKNPGGNGTKFNWELLLKQSIKKAFFLSGGIELEDIPNIFSLKSKESNLFALDINSKFELAPGRKNIEKIKKLKSQL